LQYFGEEKEFQELFFGIITICIHNVDEIIEQVGAGGYTLVLRSFAKKIKDLQGENNRFNPYHHHFLCHLGDGQFAALITFQRPHAPMELAERCRHALLEQQFPVLGDSCQPKFSMGIVNLSWEHLAPTLKLLGSLCPQKNTNVLDEDLPQGFQGRTWKVM
jgi:GGDEF domain-containing protein